jgi:hypothetical protein
MIEWKEREHEMDDLAALWSPRTWAALQACGLLVLQVTKNEERDSIARVYDWPLGRCGTRVPNRHTTFDH